MQIFGHHPLEDDQKWLKLSEANKTTSFCAFYVCIVLDILLNINFL
jgi:hypothetical protein